MKRGLKTRGGFVTPRSNMNKFVNSPVFKAAVAATSTYAKGKATNYFNNKARSYGLSLPPMSSVRGKKFIKSAYVTGQENQLTHSKSVIGRYRPKMGRMMKGMSTTLASTFSQPIHAINSGYDSQVVNGYDLCNGPDLAAVYLNALTAQSIITGHTTGTKQYKAFMRSCQGTLQFQSTTNVGQSIDVYELVPRHDSPTLVQNAFLSGVANDSYSTGGFLPTDLNCTPYMSSQLTAFWYITKKTTIDLPAGGGHIHHFTRNINKLTSRERLENASVYTGLTFSYLIMTRSGLVHDSSNKDLIATGKVGLDMKFEYTITANFVPYQGRLNFTNEQTTPAIITPEVVAQTIETVTTQFVA